MDMNMQTLDIGGASIRYASSPRVEAPTLLLLSPFPQSILAYRQIWPALAQRFDLYAVDLPGFGRSSGGEAVMDIFTQATWLASIIERLGLTRPHLLGPDVGMPVALAYAQQGGDVASLLVGDGPAVYPAFMGKPIDRMMYSAFWRWAFSLSLRSFMQATFKMSYRQYKPSADELAEYTDCYRGRLGAAVRWFGKYPLDLPRLQAGLAKISAPVNIFWGSEDEVVLPHTARVLHELLPQSEVRMFEGAGHFVYQDAADAFAQMVIDWVARQDSSRHEA